MSRSQNRVDHGPGDFYADSPYDNIPALVCMFRPDGTLTYVNQFYAQSMNLTPSQLIGANFFDMIAARDRKKVEQHYQSITPEAPFVNYEQKTIADSGEIRWLNRTDRAIFNKDSEITYYLSFGLDITCSKQLETKLHARVRIEEMLGKISTEFVNVQDNQLDGKVMQSIEIIARTLKADRGAVFLISPDQTTMHKTYEWHKPNIKSLMGSFRKVPISRFPWWQGNFKKIKPIYFSHPDDMPRKASVEQLILKLSGVKSVIAVPMKYKEKLIGFLGFESVTRERSWNETDVALLTIIGNIFASAIENNKIEKEYKTIRKQLIHSQKMEAIGNLAGGVAHDFNNLLTVIQGRAQLLMMHTTEDDLRFKDLKHILDTTSRAANLTSQLLIFSRRHEIKPTLMDFNTTIKNILRMLEHIISEDIAIVTALDPNLWNVEADEANMEQVIVNLAVNARDAMPHGGRLIIKTENVTLEKVNIKTIPESHSGNFIRVSIEDTGQGIPREIIPNIFDPFFTTKEEGKGTGLGLSVVYGIAKKHGGWVNVYSEIKHGSVFKLYLPASRKKSIKVTKKLPTQAALDGSNELILFIEDDLDVLETVKEILELSNYSVIKAASAETALEIFTKEKDHIQLIISDIILPGMSGLELVNRLKSISPDVPVIFTSGYTEEKIKLQKVVEEGAAYIQKPYDKDQLLTKIKKLLSG